MGNPTTNSVEEPKAHSKLSPSPGRPDWPPPAWGMVRVGAALLAGAVILLCLDMLAYLRLWRTIVEAKGIPGPEKILSMIYTGLAPLTLASASCFVATWASFRAKGKYALLAAMTAVAAAIIVTILIVMILAQWCPVALLPGVNQRG